MLTDVAIDKFAVVDQELVNEGCGDEVTMANMAEVAWWPGCGYNFSKTPGCGDPCYSDDWIDALIKFNKESDPGRIVSYPSRRGKDMQGDDIEDVTLRGWLLPAKRDKEAKRDKDDAQPPRIVVQHGFTANSNKFRVLTMSVILRQLGFDVLVNNLRDHCYSDNSTSQIVEWGHAYPYDTLGAWDYLQKDPDDHLGGEISAEKVGLVGFSKGAFTVLNAFSLDGDIPAAWVDSPPSTPYSVFETGTSKELAEMVPGLPDGVISFLTDTLAPAAWKNTEDHAMEFGVNLSEHLPQECLPLGPDKERPLYIVGNEVDSTVTIREHRSIAAWAKELPKKYDTQTWVVTGTCVGEDHCVDHIRLFSEYKAKLCVFWREVFNITTVGCDAE